MIDRQFTDLFLGGNLANRVPPFEIQPSRKVWNGRHYLNFIPSSAREMCGTLIDEDSVRRSLGVWEQAGERQHAHCFIGPSLKSL